MIMLNSMENSKGKSPEILRKKKVREEIFGVGDLEGHIDQKIAEYEKRRKLPEYTPTDRTELYYRILILRELQEKGTVNTSVLANTIEMGLDPRFDIVAFNKAVAVIKDYAETGGEDLKGGTGLNPKRRDTSQGGVAPAGV